MAIILKNYGLDSEAVVGSLCQGYLEIDGKGYPLHCLDALQSMGYTVLYVQ